MTLLKSLRKVILVDHYCGNYFLSVPHCLLKKPLQLSVIKKLPQQTKYLHIKYIIIIVITIKITTHIITIFITATTDHHSHHHHHCNWCVVQGFPRMSKGASCGCPLNTVSNGDSSQQIARTMVANVAKLSPSPPFLHSSTPSSSQTHYAIGLSRVFRVKMILKHAEYIMSKACQCKALRSSKGLGDLESAIATNNGEPITRPNIIIVIFWVHHETKYLCCHFSGKHQILFSLDFLSLSVLILCSMIRRTQRKALIGYDILFANSRDI